jgi:hypothetical protein
MRNEVNNMEHWTKLFGEPNHAVVEITSADDLANAVGEFLSMLCGDVKENEKPKKTVEKKPAKTIVKDIRPSVNRSQRKPEHNKFKPITVPKVVDVMFADPVTVTHFEDGTYTVAVAEHGDKYDKEVGLGVCMLKRILGNKRYRATMDKWCYAKKEMLS